VKSPLELLLVDEEQSQLQEMKDSGVALQASKASLDSHKDNND
jgi:hypothetical protein